MSDIGHNSGGDIILAAERLKSFVERLENLTQEKQALQGDISDVFGEAKGAGFDVTIIRLILKLRKMDQQAAEEQQMLLETYKRALGMAL